MLKNSIISFIIFMGALGAENIVNLNSDFEKGLKDWVSYKGPGIQKSAVIELRKADVEFKSKHVFMRLPSNATDNQTQYVKLGQYLQLKQGKKYRYSVDVKWLNPQNKLKSAIISVWTKDAKNTFNGKDVWLKDSKKQTLSFDFSPSADGQVDCYISLLTHQEGFDNTDILIDNLKITEIGSVVKNTDPRPKKNLLINSSFDSGFSNWNESTHNPLKVKGLIKSLDNGKLNLELPSANNNTDLKQYLDRYLPKC